MHAFLQICDWECLLYLIHLFWCIFELNRILKIVAAFTKYNIYTCVYVCDECVKFHNRIACVSELNFKRYKNFGWCTSLIDLMCAIACTHTTTSIISLMHVKNNMCHFCLWNLLSWTMEWIKWKKEQNIENASNWIVDHFSLTFVNILLTWMLRFHFHVWLQNKGKILKKVWRKYCNQFGIYQCFHVTLLEPWQKT